MRDWRDAPGDGQSHGLRGSADAEHRRPGRQPDVWGSDSGVGIRARGRWPRQRRSRRRRALRRVRDDGGPGVAGRRLYDRKFVGQPGVAFRVSAGGQRGLLDDRPCDPAAHGRPGVASLRHCQPCLLGYGERLPARRHAGECHDGNPVVVDASDRAQRGGPVCGDGERLERGQLPDRIGKLEHAGADDRSGDIAGHGRSGLASLRRGQPGVFGDGERFSL